LGQKAGGKMKKKDWLEVLAGAGIILFTAITPLPDDIVGFPLGAWLIADGMRWV